ncbi:MAG: C13 family peptidase [Stellaceae bacterium]
MTVWSHHLRLAVILLAIVKLAGFGVVAAAPTGSLQVVLAAGDDSEPVFDNAAREMSQRLIASGVPANDIHRFSANLAELGSDVEPAYADVLLRRIADLPAQAGDQCLIFLTSHGERGAGLWLARSNRALNPDELARALSRGCAAVPTIVIVSACYSGSFATGRMAKPNRVILTAARGDRPSFGCHAHRTYNFFDECLLGVLPQSTNWHRVFDGANRCVRRMEHALDVQPSEPQAYFGSRVTSLKVGF